MLSEFMHRCSSMVSTSASINIKWGRFTGSNNESVKPALLAGAEHLNVGAWSLLSSLEEIRREAQQRENKLKERIERLEKQLQDHQEGSGQKSVRGDAHNLGGNKSCEGDSSQA